jgi:hypothetical protein
VRVEGDVVDGGGGAARALVCLANGAGMVGLVLAMSGKLARVPLGALAFFLPPHRPNAVPDRETSGLLV